jgi:hypothetical protein
MFRDTIDKQIKIISDEYPEVKKFLEKEEKWKDH